jgi:NADH dehydrogenase FAD-containing subunit
MQFSDPLYPNFFAVGDIADTGAHKAARPGVAQAAAIAANIASMLAGKAPNSAIEISPAGIHMTLGMVSFTSFVMFASLHLCFG